MQSAVGLDSTVVRISLRACNELWGEAKDD